MHVLLVDANVLDSGEFEMYTLTPGTDSHVVIKLYIFFVSKAHKTFAIRNLMHLDLSKSLKNISLLLGSVKHANVVK